MRYLVPVFLFAVAAFVYWYNVSHTDSYLLFPLLDMIPSLRGDLEAQADWSWKIMAGIGVISLIATILGDVRKRARAKDEIQS